MNNKKYIVYTPDLGVYKTKKFKDDVEMMSRLSNFNNRHLICVIHKNRTIKIRTKTKKWIGIGDD